MKDKRGDKMYNFIMQELTGLYGQEVLKDMNEIIELYNFYEGKGQDWDIPKGLDYKPTKRITNYTKKLIKEEARFLFGKTPYFRVNTMDDNEKAQEQLQQFIDGTLKRNNFSSKLIKGARDCFIGKRVALKLHGSKEGIKIMFRPSLEFVFESKDDDIDELQKIIFFYQLNSNKNKEEQRIWKQTYELINNKCILNEAIYDGMGKVVEVLFKNHDTGLDFIPAKVIINDGLTGDLKGESDVQEIIDSQKAYNKLNSDDIDALRFNMFPQTVATDASERSLESIKIAPSALIDLQTEMTSIENRQAKMEKLESHFNYNDRFENTVNRIKDDMFDLLNIPNLSLNNLKGMITSGKSMKALYWQLITRCEEKYQEWGPAFEWMVSRMVKMAKVYNIAPLPDTEYDITVENMYPLLEDEYEEKDNDRAEVLNQVRSKKSYMEKWEISPDADEELKQIAFERELLEDSYIDDMNNVDDDIE